MTIEELQDRVLQLEDELKVATTNYDELTVKYNETIERNTKLLEQNNKLFLRCSNSIPQVEETPKQNYDSLMNELTGLF